ncbi:MAG: hypothetical protein CL431_07165 [Acidimicrobiaceae bacterium]|jgi:S1-C subfamily serine protease|nr:hypothetical protein [Acidimicrobiaceae bacterium]|tara:strand:- start:31939 stop:32619 length:681 start_codon:yes stop_codon:yes gene_type:complete
MFTQLKSKGIATFLILISLSCGQQGKEVSDQVIHEAKQSVFSVEGIACGKSSIGTGVLIDEGVLTNAHIIAGSEKLELIDSDGNRNETYPIMIDFKTDLALLNNPELPQLPLEISEPQENQMVSVLLWGQRTVKDIPVKLSRLVNIVIPDIYGEGKHTRSGMELSIEVEPGDSGGPIIDAKGQVIGLIFSRSTKQDETSYGISSSEFIKVTQNYDSSAVSSGNCRD